MRPVLLACKAARLRKQTGDAALRTRSDTGLSPRADFTRGIRRAAKMFVYPPIILALSLYVGRVYGSFHLLFMTLTSIYEETYHFSRSTVGLSYLGLGVGFPLGRMVFARISISERILKRMTRKSKEGRRIWAAADHGWWSLCAGRVALV
jgi:hypothetical protein